MQTGCDQADAEKKYGEDIYEPKSQRPDRLRVAGMQLLFGTETVWASAEKHVHTDSGMELQR